MEKMSLLKRLLGSIIDKLLIFFLFIFAGVIISPFGFSGDLGTFMGGVFYEPPSHYPWTESVMSNPISLANLDGMIATLFIITNGAYYLISECALKASVGKKIFGGSIVLRNSGRFSYFRVIVRVIILIILIGIAVYMRYPLDLGYPMVITFYFLIVDIPVLFKKVSLIDIISRTVYVKRNSLGNTTKDSESKVQSMQGESDGDTVNRGKDEKLTGNDGQKKMSVKRIGGKFLKIILLGVATFCIHSLLVFFLGDYYNVENYHILDYDGNYAGWYNENNSHNFKRKYYASSYRTIKRGRFLLFKKYISVANCGYITLKDPFQVSSNKQSMPNIASKIYSCGVHGGGTVYSYYGGRHYYYRDFIITTYDISEHLSLFGNKAKEYNAFLSKVAKVLAKNKINASLIEIKGHPAISYVAKGKNCTIFCFKSLACLVEAEGDWRDDSVYDDDVLSALNFDNYDLVTNSGTKLVILFVALAVIIAIPIGKFFYLKRTRKIMSQTAYKLFRSATVSALICLVIAAIQCFTLFTFQGVTVGSAFVLMGTLGTILIGGLYGLYFFGERAFLSDDLTIILPQSVKKYVFNEIKTGKGKKVFVSLVGYPLTVIPMFPFGIYVYLYSVPALFVVRSYLWIKEWLGWIKDNPEVAKNSKAVPSTLLINYYAVLGVSKSATLEEIEKAYTSKAAGLYQSFGTKDFDKGKMKMIQVAYKVFMNPEMRRKYDSELMAMENTPLPSEYVIQDKELIEFLKVNK